MKRLVLLCASLLLWATSVTAESDFERWKRSTQTEFKIYVDANDKAFVNFLKQSWQEVDVSQPSKRDTRPKPQNVPQATPKKVEADTTPKAVVQTPVTEKVIPEKPKPLGGSKLPISTFEFYGHTLSLPYPSRLRNAYRGPLNSDGIATHWNMLSEVNSKETIVAIEQQATALGLNDWGIAKLVDAFARSIHRDNTSRQISTWYLLVKLGFDARIAYNDHLFLLMPSEQDIFGVTFFKFQGKPYYAINLNDMPLKPGKVFTYEGQHSSGKRSLSFKNSSQFIAGDKPEIRVLHYQMNNKKYPIAVSYHEQHIKYLESYPQLSLPTYFSAGLPHGTAESLIKQLRPLVENKSELEAVNRLLHFVQNTFAYQTDEEQFGGENYLFPLETLHYPYSDCEDRAALFAWLVESLIGLDVIIVNYPGHVATGVLFSSNVGGDAITLKGKRYTIADPTYMQANAGMSMPTMNLKLAKAIAF